VQVERVYGLARCARKVHGKLLCGTAVSCLKGFTQVTASEALLKTLGPDLRPRRRAEGQAVGLCNLGNTCYMNSVLQALFHDGPFRSALLGWRGTHPVATELQRTFARLQDGAQSTVEPRDLVTALGVDPSVQQDADEFWSALVTSLEAVWASDPGTAGFLAGHYEGHLMYETVCGRCERPSRRSEPFKGLTLSIKGHTQLEDALKAAWATEALTGDDRYQCEACGLQDAVRRVASKRLPPVLVLKLLRFVYDPKRNARQKLPQAISYPHTLDLAALADDASLPPYDLTGVVLHKGKTCYQGHYIAHLRHALPSGGGQWLCADDADVTVITDYDKPKGKKGEEGRSTSGEVYMLVYTRRDPAPPSPGAWGPLLLRGHPLATGCGGRQVSGPLRDLRRNAPRCSTSTPKQDRDAGGRRPHGDGRDG